MIAPSADALFDALEATWPAARTLTAGPWTLREGLGGGKRVSAATADRATEQDIAQAEAGMGDLGQRPLFMIRDGQEALDGWLADRGYDKVDPVTLYVAPTDALSGPLKLTAAIPSWPPLAIQTEIWADGGIGKDRIAVMERAAPPKTSILGRRSDTPCGSVFVARNGEVAMLHALEVAEPDRRCGIGRTLVTASANWAAANGASWLSLAVTTANVAANALYQTMGLHAVSAYHYRCAPETRV